MSERRRTLAALALLAALVLFRTPEVLLGRAVFWAHDLRHHHLPWRAWAAQRWAMGEVPLWNADIGAGFPLAADGQTGVFYPPNLLFGLLFSPPVALSVSILAHGVWAAFGAYWLCRRMGRGEAAALLGGIGWALSGFLVARTTYAGLHAVAAWLPWLLGAAVSLARAPSRGRSALFALCVAASLTAGHPQMAAIGIFGATIAALVQRPGPRGLGYGVAGLALGVLVASPQLAASLELAGQSERGGGVDADFAAMGGLPLQELINLVLPRFWGYERPADLPLTYIHKGAAYFGTGENHWEDCIYLGFPLVLLAWVGARGRGNRWILGLTALGGVLMFGSATPAWPLLRQLPGFDFFRFPARFSALFCLGLVLLAADGLDRLLIDGALRRRLGRWSLGLALGLGLGGGGAFVLLKLLFTPVSEALLHALADHPDGPARALAILHGMLWNGSLGLMMPLAALVGTSVLLRFRPSSLVALVAVDLAGNLWNYNPTTPLDLVEETPATLAYVDHGDDLHRATVVDRVQDPSLDSSLMSASLGLLWGTHDVIVLSPLRLPEQERLLALAGLDVGMDHGASKARDLEAHLNLAEMLGIRSFLTVHELRHPRLSLTLDGPVRVYRDEAAFERAWVVGCALPASGDAAEQLVGLDLSRQALVEGPGSQGCEDRTGSAKILRYSDDEVEIAAEGPGLLVLADADYPGWIATVDGVEAAIWRTNLSLRGLPLTEGPHRVFFRYQPWWRPLIGVWGTGWFALLLLAGHRDRDVAIPI